MTKTSVIVPVYNGAEYILAALASVFENSSHITEILVIDDGSTDSSAEIAKAAGDLVRVIRQSNQGTAAAINRGIAESRSDWLAFLDADDLWVSSKLQFQFKAIEANSDLEAVFGHARQFISPNLSPDEAQKISFNPAPLPAYLPGSLLIRRSAWERIGPLDPAYEVGEFIEWYTRALQLKLRSHMLPETLLLRRLHLHNKSRMRPESRKDFLKIAQQAIAAKRKASSDAQE